MGDKLIFTTGSHLPIVEEVQRRQKEQTTDETTASISRADRTLHLAVPSLSASLSSPLGEPDVGRITGPEVSTFIHCVYPFGIDEKQQTMTIAPIVNSRSHYRDSKQIQREIWQPGDGDGEYLAECFGQPRTGSPYRFFQCHIGPISKNNEPPKYVILDDQAVHEIIQSSLYTKPQRAKFWSHDFSSTHGTLRVDRPNRGRPALLFPRDADQYRTKQPAATEVSKTRVGQPKKDVEYALVGEMGGYIKVEFDPNLLNRLAPTRTGTSGHSHIASPTTLVVSEEPAREHVQSAHMLFSPATPSHRPSSYDGLSGIDSSLALTPRSSSIYSEQTLKKVSNKRKAHVAFHNIGSINPSDTRMKFFASEKATPKGSYESIMRSMDKRRKKVDELQEDSEILALEKSSQGGSARDEAYQDETGRLVTIEALSRALFEKDKKIEELEQDLTRLKRRFRLVLDGNAED